MKEAFILKTISLHSSPGVVHIESIGYCEDEAMQIEFDARALLEDIPGLYAMAKQAIKQEEEYNRKKFVRFRKELSEDWKGKPGRKPRE
jgi:hypothetical protein